MKIILVAMIILGILAMLLALVMGVSWLFAVAPQLAAAILWWIGGAIVTAVATTIYQQLY